VVLEHSQVRSPWTLSAHSAQPQLEKLSTEVGSLTRSRVRGRVWLPAKDAIDWINQLAFEPNGSREKSLCRIGCVGVSGHSTLCWPAALLAIGFRRSEKCALCAHTPTFFSFSRTTLPILVDDYKYLHPLLFFLFLSSFTTRIPFKENHHGIHSHHIQRQPRRGQPELHHCWSVWSYVSVLSTDTFSPCPSFTFPSRSSLL
jgi:hypothetical protein